MNDIANIVFNLLKKDKNRLHCMDANALCRKTILVRLKSIKSTFEDRACKGNFCTSEMYIEDYLFPYVKELCDTTGITIEGSGNNNRMYSFSWKVNIDTKEIIKEII